jgi:glycolate oxidase FAD binding subunit
VSTVAQPRLVPGATDPIQVARLLRDAHNGRCKVKLLGHGTTVGDGAGTPLSLAGLGRITRFQPDDLTISVQAGCPFPQLRAEVERHGLWLPFDPPDAGQRTVGGAFADGVAGALAFGAQHPRDLLLGLSGALADGTLFKTGSRVVKNVAGYDLPKLFVGSRGTLFAATELHLRLYPAPRVRVLIASEPLAREDAVRVLLALRRPPLRLAALTVLSVEGGKARVLAEVLGDAAVVAWLEARCAPLRRVEEPAAEELRAVRDRQSFLRSCTPGPACSGAVLPTRLPALLAAMPAGAEFALHGDGRFTVLGAELLDAAESLGGRATTAAGRRTALPAPVAALAAAIKQTFDPHGCLPGLWTNHQ